MITRMNPSISFRPGRNLNKPVKPKNYENGITRHLLPNKNYLPSYSNTKEKFTLKRPVIMTSILLLAQSTMALEKKFSTNHIIEDMPDMGCSVVSYGSGLSVELGVGLVVPKICPGLGSICVRVYY